MRLQRIIERHWYIKMDPFLIVLLFPFSIIYEFITLIRKLLFVLHIKPSYKLPVPVVIIGNITVGGAGKTPLTKYIATELTKQGFKVGIILRGYKSNSTSARLVTLKNTSAEVGDEALIYANAGFKVAIASKRVLAGKLILEKYPNTQILLADDGMQHYYLKRDLEICVVDSSRLLGNQQLLPLGPLRENMSRLNKVSAIVVNGSYNPEKISETLKPYSAPIYNQELQFIDFYNPITKESRTLSDFYNQEVVAMAAIGNPARFYDYLDKLGLNIKSVRSFPDHYHYQACDVISEYPIITTEKDFTKILQFKPKNIWIAQVSATLNSNELLDKIVQLIKNKES